MKKEKNLYINISESLYSKAKINTTVTNYESIKLIYRKKNKCRTIDKKWNTWIFNYKKNNRKWDENLSPNWSLACHSQKSWNRRKLYTPTNSELVLKGKLGGENKSKQVSKKSNIKSEIQNHNVIGEKNWRIQKQRYLS